MKLKIEIDEKMYQQAVKLAAENPTLTVAFLQRHMEIGYAKAAAIMKKLQANGIVKK